jgi:hypothetical protein
MIQRQQTLWLLLAGVASFFTYQFPFYTGEQKLKNNTSVAFAELDGASTLFLLLLTGISILLALVTIFMFKERKNQFRLAIGGLVLSIILLLLYIGQVRTFVKGNFALSSILVFLIIIGYALAARGIWKDEKLVKSLDKLR